MRAYFPFYVSFSQPKYSSLFYPLFDFQYLKSSQLAKLLGLVVDARSNPPVTGFCPPPPAPFDYFPMTFKYLSMQRTIFRTNS